jgi:hypothetical protein
MRDKKIKKLRKHNKTSITALIITERIQQHQNKSSTMTDMHHTCHLKISIGLLTFNYKCGPSYHY